VTWGARGQLQRLQTAGRVQIKAKVWIVSVNLDHQVVWDSRETWESNVSEERESDDEENRNAQ
jgi:hypothetical protein